MKSYIIGALATALTLTVTTAMAEQSWLDKIINSITGDEKIQIVTGYGLTGSTGNALNNIRNGNPDMFTEVTKVEGCVAAKNILENTDKPTITIWDNVNHVTAADQSCLLMNEDNLLTIYGASYYYVCSKADSGKDLNNLLNNENATIGYFGDAISKRKVDGLLTAINGKAKGVPYPTSKEYLAALEIDEVDYVYTTRNKPEYNCVLTTDPNDADIKSAADYELNEYTTASFKLPVLAVNVDMEEVKKIVDSTTKSEFWSTKFYRFSDNLTFLSRVEQYKALQEEVRAYASTD